LPMPSSGDINLRAILVNLIVLMIFVVSTVWPVVLSYRKDKVAMVRDEMQNVTALTSLLRDPDGVESFEQFLLGEWSVENLLFYLQVREFKANYATRDRRKNRLYALNIFAQFIEPNAPVQVNLPADIARELTLKSRVLFRQAAYHTFSPHSPMDESEAKQSPSDPLPALQEFPPVISVAEQPITANTTLFSIDDLLNIFDAAAENCFKLMSQDTYVRFLKSPFHQQYIHVMEARTVLQREKKNVSISVTSNRSRFFSTIETSVQSPREHHSSLMAVATDRLAYNVISPHSSASPTSITKAMFV
jgi:hypothetical protein